MIRFGTDALSFIENTSPMHHYAAAFISGVVLHQVLFVRGEWHRQGIPIVLTYIVLSLISPVSSVVSKRLPAYASRIPPASDIFNSILVHIGGILISTLIYRGLFHPLRKFPGPLLARFANLYKAILNGSNLHLYDKMRDMHHRYGDYIRIGPAELSIADPAAVKAIHSPQARVPKGPWYDNYHPRVSLETTRDFADHTRLRRIWDRGFNAKALRNYCPRVTGHADKLQKAFEANLGKTINITQWFNYYSFDVMGDLAFGKSFNMLESGSDHYILSVLHKNMGIVGYIGGLHWFLPFVLRIPIINGESEQFWGFIRDQVNKRIKSPPKEPDVFHWILEGHSKTMHTRKGKMDVESEAQVIIVAGSDTTAATLTNIVYELLKNPEHVQKLRAEQEELIPKDEPLNPEVLAKFTHLNAVINETLRLHPAVPSGVQRKTTAAGLQVGETSVPPDTIIQVPFYTVFRDGRCFDRPEEFIPERWTTKPELNYDPSVFIPFNSGMYSCVGKQLALIELRWVISIIVANYDLSVAPRFDLREFEQKGQDAFTLTCGPLQVQLERRAVSTE